MADIAIRVDNISKKYLIGNTSSGSLRETIVNMFSTNGQSNSEEFWALNDVSFEVKRGDALGIIGKNGAGKSTLLKILSRITEPTKGRVEIEGRVSSLLEVGTGFHPELTGRENVFLNGTILGMKRYEIKDKFDEIVDFSGIGKFLDTPVKRYSSGMKVRLAFAVAAHLEPEILIIDEVLAVGDAEFQKKCMGKMEDVTGQGRTVLFVSHNMGAVRNLCNDGVLLNGGEIAVLGNIEKVVSAYLATDVQTNVTHEWTIENAPGNNGVKLLKADVRSANGTPFTMEDELYLEFSFYSEFSDTTKLDITFHLTDEMGNLVFVGSTARVEHGKNIAKGIFNAVCTIPANLMNEGDYYINRLLIVKNKGTILYEHNDLLNFEIIRPAEGKLGWQGKKEGIVRPQLFWQIVTEQEKLV